MEFLCCDVVNFCDVFISGKWHVNLVFFLDVSGSGPWVPFERSRHGVSENKIFVISPYKTMTYVGPHGQGRYKLLPLSKFSCALLFPQNPSTIFNSAQFTYHLFSHNHDHITTTQINMPTSKSTKKSKKGEGHERSRSGPNTRRTKFAATARNLFWAWIAHANQPVRCAESTTGESVGERSRSRLSASRRGRLVVGFGKRWDRSLNLVGPWR